MKIGQTGKVTEDVQVGVGGGGVGGEERCIRCWEIMVGEGRIKEQPDVVLETDS